MNNQNESNRVGVRVFGSSIIRVAPDSASITITVSRLEQEPRKAFASARSGAAAVLSFLKSQDLNDFGSSRVTLLQEFRYIQNEQKFIGYKAKISFSIKLRDMDRMEDLLSGVISAGANELNSVTFETTKLKELRADARKQAVAAAREKAELYCREAGASVGKLIAIEDSNPDQLSGNREGHIIGAASGGVEKAIDPAMMSVGASVFLTYEIAIP